MPLSISIFLFQHLEKYDLIPVFTEEDFLHWFLPREEIIDTYVVEKPASSLRLSKSNDIHAETDGVVTSRSKKGYSMVITDMISFFSLPSTIMSDPTHKQLKAAYSFYNVSTSLP